MKPGLGGTDGMCHQLLSGVLRSQGVELCLASPFGREKSKPIPLAKSMKHPCYLVHTSTWRTNCGFPRTIEDCFMMFHVLVLERFHSLFFIEISGPENRNSRWYGNLSIKCKPSEPRTRNDHHELALISEVHQRTGL